MGGEIDSLKDGGASAPQEAQFAPRRRGGPCCGASVAACCARAGLGLCTLLLFCLSVAALALAARVYRPDVLISSSASSPSGYYFGGAVYQGSGYWVTNKPSLPAPRSDMGVVAVGNASILLVGGQDAAGSVVASVWAFDAIHERYNTSLAPLPEPRYRFGIAAVGDAAIYVVGGLSDPSGSPLSSCRVYSVAAGSWSPCASMPTARVDLAAASLGGKVYAVGGYDADYVALRTAEVLNPSTGLWAALPPMPTGRGDLVAVGFSGRIWALGGWNDVSADPGAKFQAGVESWDPSTGAWATAANMLVGKGDLGLAMYRGSLYTFGGEVWSGALGPCDWDPSLTCPINQYPTHDTSVFLPDVSPATDAEFTGPGTAGSAAGINGGKGVWTSLAPMPGSRFRFSAASNPVSQAIFVFGGARQSGEVLADVSAFYDTVHPQAFVHYRDSSPLTLRSWF